MSAKVQEPPREHNLEHVNDAVAQAEYKPLGEAHLEHLSK